MQIIIRTIAIINLTEEISFVWRERQMASKSLEAQIHSLEETKKEFEIENRAFADISLIRVDTIQEGKPLQITFIITNMGKSPAEILQGSYGFSFFYPQNTVPTNAAINYNEKITNTYISNAIALNLVYSSNYTITKEAVEALKIRNGLYL